MDQKLVKPKQLKPSRKKAWLSQRVQSVPPSGIRAFFELVQSTKDVITLGVGEPDFLAPWHVREAAISAIERGLTRYTSNDGMPELRKEIARTWRRKYGVSYHKNEILITVGASEAIDLALRAILDEGDEVLIPEPCYVSYVPCTVFAGGRPVLIRCDEKHHFALPMNRLESWITPRTKAMIIGYPNNPTGRTLDEKRLSHLAWLAQKYDLLVISDEIYHDLTFEGSHICLASLPGMKKRTILINGFSKTHAMTGFRIGFACGPEEIIAGMRKIHQYTMLCAPHMSQYAAVEALLNGEKEVQEMREEYLFRKNFFVEGLRQLGFKVVEPQAAFYCFVKVSETKLSSEAFARELLKRQKVLVVPGNAFGPSGEGYVRMAFACKEEVLQEALRRIEQFVKEK